MPRPAKNLKLEERIEVARRFAARDGERQQIFDQFMIQQRFAASIGQFLPQAGAVPGPVMRGFRILFGQIPVP